MGIAIEDIQTGLQNNHLQDDTWHTPEWEGQVLSELALLVEGEEIVYAQACWSKVGDCTEAKFFALTTTLIIESTIPNALEAAHETRVLPRKALSEMSIAASGKFAIGRGPGLVNIVLRYEGWQREVRLPERGDTSYSSTRRAEELVPDLKADLVA